ncbi:MAG TPA: PAS domain S-box protein [Opitutus sp.]|nr:PAS domain S-box protein [Opitutus sp.]
MEATQLAPVPAVGRKVAVLLVEDDPSAAEIVQAELRDGAPFDIELVCADHLHQAIELVRGRAFDAALLDLQLPDSIGQDTYERFHQSAPDLPIIVLSGLYDEELARRLLRRGAQDFLKKQQVGHQLLAHTIQHAIERHGFAAELARRKAELEQSEIRIRRIIDASADAMLIVDPTGLVHFANPTAAAMFGRPIGDLVGQSFGFPVTTGQVTELDVRRHDGELGVAEMRVVAIDWDGRPAFLVSLHDVTERRRQENSLRLLHDLVDHSNDAFEIVDPVTARFIHVNEKDCTELGYSRAEMQALSVFDVDPTVSAATWPDIMAAVRAHGFISGEGLHRRKDGTTFPVEFNVRFARLDRDYLVSVVRDITERKRTEEAIRNSERRFRALIESSSDAIAVVDAENRILYHSPAVARVEGYSPEELSGRNGLELTHPDDVPLVRQCIAELLAHPGRPVPVLWRRRHRDGRWLWLEGVATNLLHDPAVAGIVTNYRDVTKRKTAEERIREQAMLLDKASDAIVVRGLDHVIRFWSKGAERIYGWTAAEAVGRDLTTSSLPDPEPFNAAMAALQKHDEWTGDLTQTCKDGREIVASCRWTLLRDDQGQPQSILSINTDVTEQRKFDARLLRAQRLESIGTLASGIAHDLNNVLAPIMLAVGILDQKPVDDEGRHLIDLIRVNTRRGSQLIQQVLAFGRGVEGQRLVVQPLHVAREIANIVRDTFPRSIAFDLSAPRDLWTILGDPTQLHQILINLCVNARDAMPDGGQLMLKLENVTVDESYDGIGSDLRPGHYVAIKVSDTGSGIPPDIRERIFEPFFTTKEIGKGTGLGLSTVLAITRSHGGFVNLYSEVGHGTIFKIYLPAHTDAAAPPPASAPAGDALRGRGELVLVADDEEIIRYVARRTLERAGYRVLTAANGAEAKSLYARNQPHVAVVLTDMSMPVMDGAATIAALRELNPQVKIVGSSGLSTAGGAAHASNAGLRRFISKPYVAEVLLRTLREVIDERPA